jgi:hypothetical protein
MSLFVFSVTLSETCHQTEKPSRQGVARSEDYGEAGPNWFSHYLAVKPGKRFVDSTPAPRGKLDHLYTKSLCSESFNFRSF